MTVKIYKNEQYIQDGILIEGRTYSRSADRLPGWDLSLTGFPILRTAKSLLKTNPLHLKIWICACPPVQK